MTIRKLILFLLLGLSVSLQAQNIKTVEKTYVYHAQHNESREQAERNAVNRAKVEGLREAFGTIISGASATSLITKNNITESKYVYLGGEGEVNGEWLADLEPPKISTVLEDDGFCVTATVRGKAQEIESGKINFEAKILRNTPDLEFESTEFTAGNQMFVHFTSPVDGYLAIYLLDGETAYCLLPYRGNKDGFQRIVHGREYTFFSRQKYAEDENLDEIDGYTLTTEGNHQDLNQFYFIFSPNKFIKAIDRNQKTDNSVQYPRSLSWNNFQKWILRARRADKEMSVQTQYVVISPRR
jgi:hypothetical protein